MGADGKDVGVFVWKILRFSMETTYRYVKKYPVFSGVSIFAFYLYVVLPSVFYFLLYSSPVFAFAAFYFRNHLTLKPLKIDNLSEENKTDNGLSSSLDQKGSEISGRVRNEKPYLKPQRSVRRNARMKVEEVGKDWDSAQASEDEKDKVILATLYGEIPNRSNPDFKEFIKEKTLLVPEESSFERPGESSCNKENVVIDPLEKVTSAGGETEVESSEDDDDDDEETNDDRNKAVAWTEDDQKNLMDLGISEIERNKRLENLIARRRARRLIVIDMDVHPISVGRNYSWLDQNNYGIDELQMPDSAPSVLLPARNPFDLPYDPLEEKPNLMGDSFQQEFAVANPRDIFFCRHESFRRSHYPSENLQNAEWDPYSITEKMTVDALRFSRLRPPQDVGSNEHLVEQKQPPTKEKDHTNEADVNNSCNGRTENVISNSPEMESLNHASEVHTETDSIRNADSESNSSLSPGNPEKEFNVVNQADASETLYKRNGERKYPMGLGDHVRNFHLGLAVPRHNGSSSLGAERQSYMEHVGYNTSKGHMVSHSMDSDLQVEVSEIGSPPTTVDGNDSSDDEKSSFAYESDVGKEMGFSSEEKKLIDASAKSEMVSSVSPENERSENPRELQVQSPSPTKNVLPPEISDKELNVAGQPVLPNPDKNIPGTVEEMQKLPKKHADEIKISYDSDEPEPSEKIDQESEDEKNDGEESAKEIKDEEKIEEEIMGSESSDVFHGSFNEGAASNQPLVESAAPSTSSSPRSVLLDVSVDPSLNSDDWEHASLDDQPQSENAAPDYLLSSSTSERNNRNSEESTVQSEGSSHETITTPNETRQEMPKMERENTYSDVSETTENKQGRGDSG